MVVSASLSRRFAHRARRRPIVKLTLIGDDRKPLTSSCGEACGGEPLKFDAILVRATRHEMPGDGARDAFGGTPSPGLRPSQGGVL